MLIQAQAQIDGMSLGRPVQLSRLRDIGFADWDPIGILRHGRPWKDHTAADEYDRYLMEVVGHLRRGGGEADAISYLLWAEREHMGVDSPNARERASTTVRSIKDYLESQYPKCPKWVESGHWLTGSGSPFRLVSRKPANLLRLSGADEIESLCQRPSPCGRRI